MVDRIQLNTQVYMQVDGLWQIAQPGSVLDVPAASAFASGHIIQLSPAEAAGVLASHGKATIVRGVRTR
jgi:hypothetical protein